MDVVGGHHADTQPPCHGDEGRRQPGIGRQVVALQLDPEAVGSKDLSHLAGRLVRPLLVPGQQRRSHGPLAATGEAEEPASVRGQGFQRQLGMPLLPCQLPGADQAAQVGIAPLGLGQQRQVVPPSTGPLDSARDELRASVGQGDLGADDRLESPFHRRLPEAHRAVQAIVIGQGQGRVVQHRRSLHQRLGRRGPIQQGEEAVAVQFDVLDLHVRLQS